MSKALRLLQLLDLLATHPGITMPELVQELGLSERTIYRYLNALSGDLKAPVEYDRGGYRINGVAFLKPLNFTPEELLVAALSLQTSPAVTTRAFSGHAKSALRKIEAAVSSKDMAQIQPILDQNVLAPFPYTCEETPELIQTLLEATVSRKSFRITYFSARSRGEEKFEFHPYAVVFRRHSWYTVGYSRKHKRVIQLKVLRIRSAEETGSTFSPPEGFDLRSFYAGSWEIWAGEPETEVRVRFSPAVAQIIKEVKRHPTQKIEEQPDGSVIFSVRVSGTKEIGFWILGWGCEAEVLAPPELRDEIARRAQEIVAVYNRKIPKNSSG